MTIDLSQFIPTFLEESNENLELMETGLLQLEQGDSESINAIFRAAHSIKGGAASFGFDDVANFTHLVETYLDEMRDNRRELDQRGTELLLSSVDCIRSLLDSIVNNSECDTELIASTSAGFEQLLALKIEPVNIEDPSNEKAVGWLIEFVPEPGILHSGNDPLLLFSALAELGAIQVTAHYQKIPPLSELDPQDLHLSWTIELRSGASEKDVREVFEWVEDECQMTLTAITPQNAESADVSPDKQQAKEPAANDASPQVTSPAASNNGVKPLKGKTAQDGGSIRVGIDKVDGLINLVGELVITQSMLSELGNDFEMERIDRLAAGLDQLLQNTKELQESVMQIRMLPISFAFNRFPRLVRDIASKLDKKINLQMHGEKTELDKTVMEQIGDPLVHLVRNAIDHGIETAQQRLEMGKAEEGTISLDAYHEGSNIIIEVKDDGRGINRQAVIDKAIDKGLISSGLDLTDSQVFELIFEPGFSTADEVSDLSGRGVGMDVVKSNIQALGGRIQIESQPGQGSTFRVHLPLTLAILDGQLVKVGSETYVIPLIAIVESLQIDPLFISRVSGSVLVYRLRDENIPIIPVYQQFNIKANKTELDEALLVVVEAEGRKVGLLVDDLHAQQQVVIKSLKENFTRVIGISGATILGDGSVALILDISGLIHSASQLPRSQDPHLKYH
jgi:two-component system chemotaxis sensor kinase CheA